MRLVSIAGVVLLTACARITGADREDNYRPPNGIVPDSVTAVRIALAVWLPIYGERTIEPQAPYNAQLRDGVWTVTGHFPTGQGYRGGVALAEISQRDGRVLRVTHGK